MASPTSPFNPFLGIQKSLGGQEYSIEHELSKGAVWTVFKARNLSTQKYYAVKEALASNLRQEIDILTKCIGRENILQLIKACRDDSDTNRTPLFAYVITELCSTDLAIFLRDLGGRFPADQLRVAAKHLADGCEALSNAGILHKNLSSKNILVHLLGSEVALKISGFNCSVMIEKSIFKRAYTITGRAQYMAPEIGRAFVKKKRSSTDYTPKSDLWSLGVILYELAYGKFPFTSSNLLDLFKSARHKDISIDFSPLHTSDEAAYCNLIRRLLRANPDDRPDSQNLRADECFAGLQSGVKIQIGLDRINEAMRIYDLSWTLPVPIALVRVRDYEYNECIELGKGSFGKVWRAKRLSDGTKVALKRVHVEDVDLAEIQTMQTVVHPNLLRLIDHFEQFPYMYIITELCACDFPAFVKRFPNERLRHEQDARILSKHLASAYMAMQSAQIIHRDVKPSNVLVSIDTDGGASFKLGDFGCSKSLTHVEYAQTVLGTPFYMAPELGACLYLQINTAHYDHRADIWSMGLIVFQSLAGKLPFEEADLLRLLYDVGTDRPTDEFQENLKREIEALDASLELRNLLFGSICADYTKRMTAADFFQHQFHAHLPLNKRLHL